MRRPSRLWQIREHPRQQVHFNLFAEDWHKRQAIV